VLAAWAPLVSNLEPVWSVVQMAVRAALVLAMASEDSVGLVPLFPSIELSRPELLRNKWSAFLGRSGRLLYRHGLRFGRWRVRHFVPLWFLIGIFVDRFARGVMVVLGRNCAAPVQMGWA
jgi:hypothetical protein